MKHFFKLTCAAAILTAGIIALSSFKQEVASTDDRYCINLMSKTLEGGNEQWTWVLTNPNPGNGLDGTLQNVSHFDIVLTPQAEAALLAAEYSYDGITWVTLPIEVERDPAIRACTSMDVLKFNAGTTGSEPTYYRATFSEDFESNPFATSWIKSGVRTGCNNYYFTGMATPKLD